MGSQSVEKNWVICWYRADTLIALLIDRLAFADCSGLICDEKLFHESNGAALTSCTEMARDMLTCSDIN